jgi:hypothetical protein
MCSNGNSSLLNMKKVVLVLAVISIVVILHSCKIKSSSSTNECDKFLDDFYTRFTSDSLFQLSRIQFPLKGQFADGETAGTSESSNFVWTPQNWNIIHDYTDIDPSEFDVKEIKSDTVVVKKILGKNTGFRFEATYKLIECKWTLVHLVSIDI